MDDFAPPATSSRTLWHSDKLDVAGSMPGESTPLRMKLLVDGGGSAPTPKPTKTTATKTTAVHKVAPSTPAKAETVDKVEAHKTKAASHPVPPATGGAKGAAKGAGAKPPAPVAPPRRHSRFETEEIANIRSEKEAAARTATVLDKTLPPKERKKLLAEQKKFFGVQTVVVGTAGDFEAGTAGTGAASAPVAGGPKVPKSSKVGGAQGAPGGATHPLLGGKAAGGADGAGGGGGATAAPVGGALGGAQVTPQQRLDYFKHHPYYIAGKDEVWKVDVSGTDVHLSRTNDPSGSVDQYAGRPSYINYVDEHGKKLKLGPYGSIPIASAQLPTQVTTTSPKPTPHRGMVAVAATYDEFGVGGIDPKDVKSKSASGFVTLSLDGSSEDNFSHSIEAKDNSTLSSYMRAVHSPDPTQSGMSMVTIASAHHEDGSSATITRSMGTGALRNKDLDPNDPNAYLGTTQVTQTDAHGATVTTSSDRPRPRSAPGTLDEVRAMQDELGLAETAKVEGNRVDPTDKIGSRIFATASRAAAVIDIDEISKALLRGEAKIGKDHPDQVQQWGDAALAHTREKFASWGLDAADGNELVDRKWIDKDLPNNAYYDPGNDKFDFGVGEDGTPFGFGTDVISHEFTHRIDHTNVNMPYQGEQGAIDESLADTMAAAVDTDYQVGEDVIPKQFQRDMSRPATVRDFVKTDRDQGGVHTNSAIPNYAAYLIGSKVGHDKLGAIYAKTIDEHLDSSVTFEKLASGTWQAASELYGAHSPEVRAVEQAWDSVLELHGSHRLWPATESGSDASHSAPGRAR